MGVRGLESGGWSQEVGVGGVELGGVRVGKWNQGVGVGGLYSVVGLKVP